MAEWVVQKKLSFSESFYHRSKDDADPLTTMPSSQCDPLVARGNEYLPGKLFRNYTSYICILEEVRS